MARVDDAEALAQLRATLGALTSAELERKTQRDIFDSVSAALGGVAFSSPLRAQMKAELEGFLVRLSQSQGEAASTQGGKRPRKAAAPQRRRKAASSGEDDESEPSAEASDGEEEASDSDFEETEGALACTHACMILARFGKNALTGGPKRR